MSSEFLVLVVLLCCSVSGLLLLRHKNRLIWRELFRLRKECEAIRHELLNVRKQVILETEQGETRLPLLLPSQNGEDLLLWNFFGRKRTGFYLDVGAYDGIAFSNTYFFESLGWDGILVEAVPEFYQACLSSRPNSKSVNAVAGKVNSEGSISFSVAEGRGGVGTLSYYGNNPQQLERITREGGTVRTAAIPVVSLNQILQDHHEGIDFVSIDVEGSELDVLQGFDLERFRPRVLVVEDNSAGADTGVKDYLSNHGYEERLRCEQNVFYTRSDDRGGFSWSSKGEALET